MDERVIADRVAGRVAKRVFLERDVERLRREIDGLLGVAVQMGNSEEVVRALEKAKDATYEVVTGVKLG